MRIDDSTRFQSHLSSLQNHASKALQYQTEISTGSRVNKPSDDPALYQLKDELEQRLEGLQTDQKSLSQQATRLNHYDSSLGSLAENVRKARSLVQRASNASSDATAIAGMRNEMDRLIDGSLSLLNSEEGGRYLFAGTRVETPPFQAQGGTSPVSAVSYQGDDRFPGVPLPGGRSLQLPLDGRSVTQTEGVDLLNTFIDLRNQLQGSVVDAEPAMSRLVKLENGLLQRRGEVGSATSYLSQLQSHLQAQELHTREQLAGNVETDLPQSITNLLQNQTAQQATFSVISRQAKLSLVDFLR
ncbi:hypothetical protein IV102_34955 [bacterium]|nr:hypothetical protein [bacterium]